MKPTPFAAAARALLLALMVGAAAPSFATPVMEMRSEDLLPMAPEIKKELNLNANQQILWQQTENKSRTILRDRQSRRERLQQRTKAALEGSKVELRDLVAGMEAEEAASAAETRQLRELWLTMNDALDENQRQMVVTLVSEQLMRVPDNGASRAAPRGGADGGGSHRGMGGRGKPGGGMSGGMGGSGG